MPLSSFHPAVQSWFLSELGRPTEPQLRGWPPIRSGKSTLIAAPTGSGKTLAAFLAAIDSLFREGLTGLGDETRVVYVSPLKALSNDVQKNLLVPLEGIRERAARMGLGAVEIRPLLRTGDTTQRERAAMIRRPPHILVTTPESLYLLVGAEKSREMLRTVRSVIVDEIHAVARDRRGAHLALTLERLEQLAPAPLQRIGLSATQRPIEEMARFLVGAHGPCEIVDVGHGRAMDLAVEIPSSPLEPVMAGEVWEEVYDRVAALAREHRTTLVFVNTRRLAERIAARLASRLGEDRVASHHGSLSRDRRLSVERRLKAGELGVLVATASLELGIDVGTVDLVCQIGSTRSIATLLQRVGRSGHSLERLPKGHLFPLSPTELVECAALIAAVRRSELDLLRIPDHPLDVLAQQIVAAVACEEWDETRLYDLFRRAHPYRALERKDFDAVVEMLAEGFTGRRGRRGRLIHQDRVGGRLRARRGSRLVAATSGGAIPDTADYRVVLEPTGTVVGSVNEDFAVESAAGDIFQLGNSSWRIVRVLPGEVRVEDARGQLPNIPFWLGEAPARSDELSREVSRVRSEVGRRLDDPASALAWLRAEAGLDEPAARQLVEHLASTRATLGVIPTDKTLVLERFFDESGGMQLVLHAPLGARINRAWGLALRKRFCRRFDQELQAAATEDAILLSLGPQHSFPLEDVWSYLRPDTVRALLVQALLVAPMFEARWRWNATRSLAVPRHGGGRRIPTQLQRIQARDLLAAVFPDQAACAENSRGDREIPDHPLVRQTIDDCLEGAMDCPGLERILADISAAGAGRGRFALVARDTTEPSPLAREALSARPYAFLDDAPLEERRTFAVQARRALDPETARDIGALDPEAIERIRAEAWPMVGGADDLHDALYAAGCLADSEIEDEWRDALGELVRARRAGRLAGTTALWITAERQPLWNAIRPGEPALPALATPERDRRTWSPEDACREVVRGRMEIAGPTTAQSIAGHLGLPLPAIEAALLGLEAEGVVLRGHFTSTQAGVEWCERGLLARIHRATVDRLRREIEPVPAADLVRFLFRWQHVGAQTEGPSGLEHVLEILDGFEAAAAAWERDLLPCRLAGAYDPRWLDALCLSGEVGWGRLGAATQAGTRRSGPIRTTPISIFHRANEAAWRTLAGAGRIRPTPSSPAERVAGVLAQRGASFFADVVSATGLLRTEVESSLGELVGLGLATSDGFAGLRALLTPAERRPRLTGAPPGPSRRRGAVFSVSGAGRWSLRAPADETSAQGAVEAWAGQLLRRWGVVFRRLLEREPLHVPWRDLVKIYRRLEARSEIRGGRFVAGFSGEQFAAPEAVGLLRQIRRDGPTGDLVAVSPADPLNLVGVITPGHVVPVGTSGRILYRDGAPVAVGQRGQARFFTEFSAEEVHRFREVLGRTAVPPILRSYLQP